jgi:hypothetical protein
VVESADPNKKIGVLKVIRTLKGKCTYTHIRMNIGVGQMWHPETMLPHLVPGAPVLLFYNREHKAIGYLNRFFFQLYGDPARLPARAWWTFTHVEIHMNRTFDGSAEELTRLVRDILTGRAKPPGADSKKKPFTKEQLAEMPKAAASGEVPVEPDKPLPVPQVESAQAAVRPDEEGFLRTWLLLDPISIVFAGQHDPGVEGRLFDREWYAGPDESRFKPGDRVQAANREREWFEFRSADSVVSLSNFSGQLDKNPESRLYLGLVYLHCETEIADVRLAIGSGDSSRWVLNGTELVRAHGRRDADRDQDVSKPVTLKKGLNLLRFYVVNGFGDSGCCARFLDSKGRPVLGYFCTPSPEPPVQLREY